jgi:hypothetical protein
MRARLALVAALCATAAMAADLEIPTEYRGAVERANELGEKIHRHDMAAWRATDALMKKVGKADARVRGWLTDEYVAGSAYGIKVSFIGETADGPSVLYLMRISSGGPPYDYVYVDPPERLDDSQLARWRARGAAEQAVGKRDDRCGETYNTVVIPVGTGSSKGILVYMLAATTQPDLLIGGGHFLYEYSGDGTRLLSQRAFTKSCIDIPFGKDSSKGEVAALTLTHLLDRTPTEVHSWLSYNYGKTLYLGTMENSMMWIIMKGHIIAARPIDGNARK